MLAVVPATAPSLTANQAIAMILEHGKQEQTIIGKTSAAGEKGDVDRTKIFPPLPLTLPSFCSPLFSMSPAMTMCDLVQPANFMDRVINRLLERGKELEGYKFGGLVATINRDHYDTECLTESNLFELHFFQDMLEGLMEGHPELEVFKPQLEEHLSTANAIRLLDGLFHNHIKISWLPRALASLEPKFEECREKLTSLGPCPTDASITVDTVRNRVMQGFKLDDLRSGILAKVDTLFAAVPPVPETMAIGGNEAASWDNIRVHAACRHFYDAHGEEMVAEIFRHVLHSLAHMIASAFVNGPGDEASAPDLKLERFEKLREAICAEAVTLLEGEQSHLRQDLRAALTAYPMRSFEVGLEAGSKEVASKFKLSCMLEVRRVLHKLESFGQQAEDAAGLLTEREGYRRDRATWTNRQKELLSKKEAMMGIDEAIKKPQTLESLAKGEVGLEFHMVEEADEPTQNGGASGAQ